MTFRLMLAAGLAAAALTGCQNAADAERDAVMARLAKRKNPGYVRVVNLGTMPATLKDNGRQLVGAIDGGSFSKFAPVGTGNRTIQLEVAGKKSEAKVDLTSELGTTVLLGGNGTVVGVVQSERRYPDGDNNLRTVFLDRNGKPVATGSVRVSGPAGPLDLKAPGETRAIEVGRYSMGDASVTVEPKYSYTFLFLQGADGKFRPFLMLNTNDDKPAAAGTAT